MILLADTPSKKKRTRAGDLQVPEDDEGGQEDGREDHRKTKGKMPFKK